MTNVCLYWRTYKRTLKVCYQSLSIFQILSKKLDELGTHYSVRAILDALKNMAVSNHGYRYFESNYTNSKVLQSLKNISIKVR